MNDRICPPCNGNCNQGRNCPNVSNKLVYFIICLLLAAFWAGVIGIVWEWTHK